MLVSIDRYRCLGHHTSPSLSTSRSGLFSNAIIESGACDAQGLLYLDGDDAKIFGASVVKKADRYTAEYKYILFIGRYVSKVSCST